MNTAQHKAYLQAMGIQTWRRRVVADAVDEPVPMPAGESAGAAEPRAAAAAATRASHVARESSATEAVPVRDVSQLDWEQLRAAVSGCTACELHKTRTQTVFGVGDRQAQWMVIGEAPGAEEDRQGEPFVGRAGQLLNNMLKAVGLSRQQVYIANILKCRPPNNRDPRPEEIARCEGYLRRQVVLVQPKVILAVGRIAAHNLLKTNDPLGRLRGRKHLYGDTPLVVTYHPAYLLRTPRDKGRAWEDLRLARRICQEAMD